MKYCIILLLSMLSLQLFASKLAPFLFPPPSEKEKDIKLYPNYLVYLGKDSMSFELSFAQDNYVYSPAIFGNDIIGEWRTFNDTLFIYEKNQIDFKDTLLYRATEKEIMLFGYTFLHSRDFTDLKLPRNVSIFKIINNGDSLVSLDDEMERKGIPISEKAVRERHGGTNIGSLIVPNNWKDTLVWQAVSMPSQKRYTVTGLDCVESKILKVTVRNNNVSFNILNPKYYQQEESRVFVSAPYTDWFDYIAVYDTISLELTRPAYEQEVLDRSLYLKGYPDSVYVLDNEAYGYWFARPIYNNR